MHLGFSLSSNYFICDSYPNKQFTTEYTFIWLKKKKECLRDSAGSCLSARNTQLAERAIFTCQLPSTSVSNVISAWGGAFMVSAKVLKIKADLTISLLFPMKRTKSDCQDQFFHTSALKKTSLVDN